MKCVCGYSIPAPKASNVKTCMVCGKPLTYESTDYLLYKHNNLVQTVRPGQVEMAKVIDEVIAKSGVGLIEGPVGIGKSFGYTVPAILSGKRIVISTAKKQLQHQIAQKDVPYLAIKLDKPDLQVALLKGKSNYACRLKAMHELDDQPEELKAFVKWMDDNPPGDISSYPGRRPKWWWNVTAEDCGGAKCPKAKQCGYYKNRLQAATAQVIVANHHVVAYDLKFGPFRILPPYDVLVIDEAHQAAAAFRGAFSFSVSPFQIQRIYNCVDDVGMTLGPQLKADWESMFNLIKDMDGEIPKDPFGDLGLAVIKSLGELNKLATDEINAGGGKAGYDDEEDPEDFDTSLAPSAKLSADELMKYERLKRTLARTLEALRKIQAPDANECLFISTNGVAPKRYKTVTVSPISVGPYVGPKIEMIPATIITSATLSINGSFSDIRNQMGIDYDLRTPPSAKPVITQVLETPFDYKRQAVLYTPKHIPLPASTLDAKRPAYLRSLTLELARLIKAADGNAFVLFTATTDMNDVFLALQEEDIGGVHLITQGDDAESAFQEFKNTPRSVILGLKSFWEGVDVVGDKLRLVVITKLPFPQLSDPVIKARERIERNAALQKGMDEKSVTGLIFNQIQVPMMVTDVRQGVGRLIRSTTDRGVCAILDTRVWTGSGKFAPDEKTRNYRGYGATVVNAIGFQQKTADFNNVAQFLKMIKDTP